MAPEYREYTWDKKQTIQLIHIYKENPALWDPRHKAYKSKKVRQSSIRNISERMGVDEWEVERKFKNIVSHYLRELKREEASRQPLSGRIYNSKWFAYNALSYIKDRPVRSKLRKSKKHNETPKKDNDTIPEDCKLVMIGSPKTEMNDSEESIESDTMCTNDQLIEPKFEDPLTCEESSLDDGQLHAPAITNVKDNANIFGEYIANKVRPMDPRTRAIVEYEINSIIFKADMGYFNNKKYKNVME